MGISSQKYPGLWATIIEVVVLAISMIAVPLVIALDVVVLGHGLTENSVTEFIQEVLLFLSMLLIGLTARQNPNSRGFLVLLTGLFAAMFIREIDKYLDTITQGFWFYPAVLVSLGACVYARRLRGTVITPMIEIFATKSFAYLVIGLLLVVLFSRVFGTGELWQTAMGADYRHTYKSMIQEGLELLGYVLICFGSVRIYLREPGGNPQRHRV